MEALSGRFTLQEVARKFEIHPQQISQWKSHFLENAELIFEKGSDKNSADPAVDTEKLYKIIGEQKVQIDFLKHASSNLGL